MKRRTTTATLERKKNEQPIPQGQVFRMPTSSAEGNAQYHVSVPPVLHLIFPTIPHIAHFFLPDSHEQRAILMMKIYNAPQNFLLF
jgi:hypothetical protein